MEEAFDGWSGTKGQNDHDFSEYFLKTVGEKQIYHAQPSLTGYKDY